MESWVSAGGDAWEGEGNTRTYPKAIRRLPTEDTQERLPLVSALGGNYRPSSTARGDTEGAKGDEELCMPLG
ncbi:hypothetical protein HMPREF1556_01241 [Porphyromonas sp. oral taxon 278 str. W7784]|nr:hypothetical protein HMPREF1556_01241 [Porphyromonas sp. oral taxon 278 str. W7784]